MGPWCPLGTGARAPHLSPNWPREMDPLLGPRPHSSSGTAPRGPESGATWRGHFWPRVGARSPLRKAGGYWHWHNFLEDRAATLQRRVVRINMDESPIPAYLGTQRGAILTAKGDDWGEPCREHAPRWLQRLFFTFFAFICDHADLQLRLPQILLTSAAKMPEAMYERIFFSLPENIYMLRRTSGWCKEGVMLELLRMLGRVCREFNPNAFYILVMDCASAHIGPNVLRNCALWGFHLVLVPALVTWLLQPLDVVVFRLFKMRLRTLWHAARIAGADPTDLEAFFAAVAAAIAQTFCVRTDWSDAFRQVGLGARQRFVSRYICNHLQVPEIPTAPATEPVQQILDSMLPARRNIPVEALLATRHELGYPPRLRLPRAAGPRGHLAEALRAPALVDAPSHVVHSVTGGGPLTRSMRRRIEESAASQGPSLEEPTPAAWPAAPPPAPPMAPPMPLPPPGDALPEEPPRETAAGSSSTPWRRTSARIASRRQSGT